MLRNIFLVILVVSGLDAEQVDNLPIQGDIVRAPEDGIIKVPEDVDEDDDYSLNCRLKEGNELVSDVQWFRRLEGEWERLDESGSDLDVGEIFIGNKYTHKSDFKCQIGQENMAQFTVFIGNRSANAKTQFKIKPFVKSYDVDEGEDFTIQCEIVSAHGDVAEIKKSLGYRWFKWTNTDDQSYITKDEKGKVIKQNCTHFLEHWQEISGDEIEEEALEPHIQLLTNNTLKIEDARMDDRRGYMCVSFNVSSPDICSGGPFFVRVKDKYAAVWPFIGIVAEVVVLCLIIFICERRKAAKDAPEEEEEYNGNAVRSENSNLRQRRS